MMRLNTTIEGLVLIEPKIFSDERGYFYETYSVQKFKDLGIDADFVQDNQSFSSKGALRGLHFQKPPYAQAKLVRVIKGKVIDIAVDIREGSKTYGTFEMVELSEENHLQFYIPIGFAHGFITLEKDTIFCYKCSNYYNKESEGGILWSDPSLNIDWGSEKPRVSDKDLLLPTLENFKSPFTF
jgi:dTDP-4-dehydrorhamnose 3,5-epimerase